MVAELKAEYEEKHADVLAKEAELEEREKVIEAREQHLEAEKVAMKARDTRDEDLIVLNVGGTEFQALRRTLCLVETSTLAAMFSGRWNGGLKIDEDGRIFVDWDADRFKMILSELRDCSMDSTRKLRVPDPSVRPLWGYLSLPRTALYFDGSQVLLTDEHEKWLHDMVIMESASGGDGGDIDIVPKLLYECTDDSKSAEAFHG